MPTTMTVVAQPASNLTQRLKVPGFTVQLLKFFFGAGNLYFQNLHIFFNFLSLEVQGTFFSAVACCCCGTRGFWCERQMLWLQRLVELSASELGIPRWVRLILLGSGESILLACRNIFFLNLVLLLLWHSSAFLQNKNHLNLSIN